MKTRSKEHPGCPRCRQDLIRFTRVVALPRFTMERGELWHLPQARYNEHGDAELGGGYAPAGSFEIVEHDFSRGSGCCSMPDAEDPYWHKLHEQLGRKAG